MNVGQVRKCAEGAKWCGDVYKKYNRTCDISGQILQSPVAHHLTPFIEIFKEWRDEEDTFYKKILWLRLFDVNNGVVLSEHLHRKYHSKYKGNICEDSYKEFKKDWKENNLQYRNFPVKVSKLGGWLEVVEIN